jgi:hypothetical protein
VTLAHAWADGTRALVFGPVEFLMEIEAAVAGVPTTAAPPPKASSTLS